MTEDRYYNMEQPEVYHLVFKHRKVSLVTNAIWRVKDVSCSTKQVSTFQEEKQAGGKTPIFWLTLFYLKKQLAF